MEKGFKVKINSPLQSLSGHRFAYILYKLPKSPAPKKVMLMPYLHERKVVLNRIKSKTKYFYTSFKVSDDMNTEMINYQKQTKADEITLIVCFNLLEAKIYMYLENGVIAARYDYSIFKHKYGEIVATSSDGLNFIFKKKSKNQISYITLDINGLKFNKSIDSAQLLKTYIKSHHKHLSENHQRLFFHNPINCTFRFQVNNDRGILIEITKKENEGAKALKLNDRKSKTKKIVS